MARQVLPIVGAVIGAYFGGPQGAQIGYAIGSFIGNEVDPLVVRSPSIGDSRTQTSAEVFMPIYYGTACAAGNVIMAGPDVKRIVETQQGKGSGPITESERIDKTFAIGIGKGWTGQIVGITRIWEMGKLVYDTTPESTMLAESAKFARGFRLYLGTQDQLPDPDLEAIPADFGGGIGNVPAFRGLAYIVFPKKDITPWMSIPQYQFEIVTAGAADPMKSVIALRTRSVGSSTFGDELLSETGEIWDGTWTAVTNAFDTDPTRLISTDRSIVAHENTGQARYRYGYDGEWQSSAGEAMSGSGGLMLGTFFQHPGYGDIVLIPGGTAGSSTEPRRSVDYGASFQKVIGAPDFNVCEEWDGVVFALDQDGHAWRSDTAGLTYGALSNHNFSGPANITCKCKAATGALFAGSNGSGGARIWAYNDLGGVELTAPSFPSGGSISRIVEGMLGSETMRVCLSANGEIARKTPTMMAWDYPAQSLGPMSVGALWWNGTYFIASTSYGNDHSIWVSTDAETWTQARTESFLGNIRDITSLFGDLTDVVGTPIPLDQVVANLSTRVGMPAEKFDVTDLASKTIGGFIVAGPYTAAGAILSLAELFQFDCAEWDEKIRYRFRGRPVVATITEDDLVDEPDEGLREDQIEYPRKLHLEAQNTISGYAPAKETSERESSDVRVVTEISVSAPVVFAGTPDEQANEHAQRANILHKKAWEDARGERELVVSDRFLRDVPGDCYQVNIRGRSDRMAIVQQNYVDGVIRLRLRYDRMSAYTSRFAGNTPRAQTPPPSTIPGPTQLTVLDIPALLDSHDVNTALRYIAMGPVSSSWYGALVEDGIDGANYARLLRGTSGTVMGTLVEAVTAASEHFTDTTNVVHLELDLAAYSERVQSLTYEQFLSEGGAFALVNEDGDVEILQYMDVEDLGDGELKLTTLLRGRANSGTYAFPVGSRFVLLAGVYLATTPSAYVGQTVYHRATSYGSTSETAISDNIEFQGKSQIEFPVANLLLSRAGDIVTATAVPRHRFGTEMAPIRSINWSGYRWTATDGANTITRETTTDSTDFDVTGWASPVTVTVRQFNRFPWGDSEPRSEDIA